MTESSESGRPSANAVRDLQAALRTQGAAADPMAVVQAHVAAVHSGDPELMAADYHADARITRGAQVVVPLPYFRQAIGRLGDSRVVVKSLRRDPAAVADMPGAARIVMEWEMHGGKAAGTAGTDTFVVRGDRIVDQQEVLHTADY